MALTADNKPYHVSAGTLELVIVDGLHNHEPNYKYCDSFETLDEAMKAMETCRGYDFIDLEYSAPDGKTYSIDLHEIETN